MKRIRRRSRSYVVKLEPEQLEQLKLQLQPPRKRGPEFTAFAARFLVWAVAERQKPSAITSKTSVLRLYLTPRFKGRHIGDISESDVLELKSALASKSAKYVANVLTVLRKLLKVAVQLGELDQVPVQFGSPRVDKPSFAFLDFEQYEHLVDAARRTGQLHLALTLLAGDAGLRMGELLALQWDDVDRKSHLVVRRSEWRKQVTLPKGGRSRSVPMTIELGRALEQLGRGAVGERVLRRVDGGRLTYQGARTLMCQVQRTAAVDVDGRVHLLRHTFCSHLAMRGAALIAIKELAGHVHASTTERYMHLAPAERIKTIGLLDQARASSAPAARESL